MNRKKPCRMDGCQTMTYASRGYCQEHFSTVRPCRDEGCQNRVSVQSHYGFCRDHYRMGPKTKPVP